MLTNKTLIDFLEETASGNPVPGGGSIAAQSGAAAAALVEMVANLTIGKKKYAPVEDEMKMIGQQAKDLRKTLLEDVDRDSEAFHEVMNAFKLQKETEEEKVIRREAIQKAMKHAAAVPLEVAKKSLQAMHLSKVVVEKGNSNTITDSAVSIMMGRTAVLSALYNVRINLTSIKDQELVQNLSMQVEAIEKEARALEEDTLKIIAL